jgi:hypothetical protein
VTSVLTEEMWLPAMPTLTGLPRKGSPHASIASATDSVASSRSTITPRFKP